MNDINTDIIADNTMTILSWKLQGMLDVCEKKNAKLEKLGYGRPLEIKVVREFTKVVNGYNEGGDKIQRKIPMIELEIEGPSFVKGAYQLVAVIDHIEGGNVVRAAGQQAVDPKWYTAAANCDHCGHNRRRNRTILVRENDGAVKQVGASCVCAYTGHGGASSVLSAFYAMFSEAKASDLNPDDLGRGGSMSGGHDVTEFLAAVLIVTDGGKNYDREATVAQANACIWKERDRKTGALYFHEVEEADIDAANALIDWAKGSFTRENSYEANLLSILNSSSVIARHLRMLASLVASHRRAMGIKVEVKEELRLNEHVGETGTRVVLEKLTLIRTPGFHTQFGYTTIFTFEDTKGRCVIWKTTSDQDIKIGDVVDAKATIKAHGTYNEIKQTELSRAKLTPSK
jgi:hypothetical protein